MKSKNIKLPLPANDGFALMATAVFAVVAIMLGFAFFAVTASETKGAHYRQDSAEAFFLADGAIERARARLLEDATWRAGWNAEAGGNGTYDLALRDTVIEGQEGFVKLLAAGHVGTADRHIEALVHIPPVALELSLFVGDDAEIDGELCLQGMAHVGDNLDYRPNNGEIDCGGTLNTGFVLTPPVIRTEPEHYPSTTYYYVLGDRGRRDYIGRIFDQYGNEWTDRAGDEMQDVVSYKKNQDLFTFEFDRGSLIEKYFDDEDGVFRRHPGDVAVVVNFGAPSLLSSSQSDRAEVILDGNGNSVIHATIINTRFQGYGDSQRLDPDRWYGGTTELGEIALEPFNGIAVVASTLLKEQPNDTTVGSAAYPALAYATEEVEDLRNDFEMTGTLITLGDFFCDGDVSIAVHPGLLAILPEYLTLDLAPGVSGAMEMVRWVEGDPDRD